MTSKTFDIDPFPGEPKILFIGHPQSTHTHSWIELLNGSKFNIRLFGVPTGYPPPGWKIPTYVTVQQLPEGLEPETCQYFYPNPGEWAKYHKLLREQQRRKRERDEDIARQWQKLAKDPIYRISTFATKCLDRIFSFFKMPRVYQEFRTLPATSKSSVTDSQNPPVIAPRPKAPTIDAWLAQIIQEWKPNIIHTLGLDHEQGGFFYHSVRKTYKLEKFGKWVIQLRGGSDLTLNRYDPKMAARISGILQECDTIICDNTQNIIYAEEMGVPRKRFADIVPIPGTGGIDLEAFSNALSVMPSQRERIILWTKAYNCQWSQALPVFEAIKIAWDRIKPCTIHMLAMPPDVRMWYNALPPAIRRHCTARDRIPRQEVLSLMQKSRVLLSPSLVDGIPNSLYEAMATGVFPIVSPLETIISLVENEQNVLFARNLYPDEIAHAIERSMRDDALLDAAAKRNFAIVRRLADRVILAPRVVAFYEEIGAL